MSNQPFVDRRSINFAPSTTRSATLIDANYAPPQLNEENGSPSWIVRAANFVVTITRAMPGTRLVRKGQVDEYMLFVPPGVTVDVEGGGERLTVELDFLRRSFPQATAGSSPMPGGTSSEFSPTKLRISSRKALTPPPMRVT